MIPILHKVIENPGDGFKPFAMIHLHFQTALILQGGFLYLLQSGAVNKQAMTDGFANGDYGNAVDYPGGGVNPLAAGYRCELR